jgi:hypothetical protein
MNKKKPAIKQAYKYYALTSESGCSGFSSGAMAFSASSI